jgi:hypothetical protein
MMMALRGGWYRLGQNASRSCLPTNNRFLLVKAEVLAYYSRINHKTVAQELRTETKK